MLEVPQHILHQLSHFTAYVTTPTHPASLKTRDLVLSSVPSLVSFARVTQGMKDHDIVLFNIRYKYSRTSRLPLKLYQYYKADFDKLRRDVSKGDIVMWRTTRHSSRPYEL